MGAPRKAIPPTAKRSRTFGKGGGRPAGFEDVMIAQATELVARGFTDAQIADFFEVHPSTLWRWKQHVPAFGKAFLRGEKEMQAVLEASMLHRATGYSHQAVKIFPPREIVTGTGKKRKVTLSDPIVVKFEEHFPPDKGAAELLLRKLDPGVYNPRMTVVGDPKAPVQFIMQNRPPKEKKHG